MADTTFDVIIIGSGPGGYIAAIRAAQLGFRTAIVEKYPRLGGTCLNVGCIPSKALLDSSELYHMASHSLRPHGIQAGELSIDVPAMIARKRRIVDDLTRGVASLMRKNKITVLTGTASFTDPRKLNIESESGIQQIAATTNILIATGSVSAQLPNMPFDGKVVVSSSGALEFQSVPRHLVVVGGGYIGLELGSVWRRLGAEVTVVEMLPGIVPFMDRETAQALFKSLQRQGLGFMMEARVSGIQIEGESAKATVEKAGGETEILDCDKVLVSVGRKPYTEGLNLEAVDVRLDERGRIKVNDRYQTNIEGISAIGDVIAGPMLAHKAGEEGVAWAELLAGKAGHVNYDAIPSVVYTWPEVASVGLSEEQACEQFGEGVRIGKFPFMANGRAKAMAEREGFVKVVSGPRDRVQGVHIFGPRASDMIAEAVAVMEFQGTAEDIARTCHAHPTLSEALKEAALAANGRVIHL